MAGKVLPEFDRIDDRETQLARRRGRQQAKDDVVERLEDAFVSGLRGLKQNRALLRIGQHQWQGNGGGPENSGARPAARPPQNLLMSTSSRANFAAFSNDAGGASWPTIPAATAETAPPPRCWRRRSFVDGLNGAFPIRLQLLPLRLIVGRKFRDPGLVRRRELLPARRGLLLHTGHLGVVLELQCFPSRPAGLLMTLGDASPLFLDPSRPDAARLLGLLHRHPPVLVE